MIYICTHKAPAYKLDCDYKVVRNDDPFFGYNIADKGNLYRNLRGIYQIWKNYELPDEIGCFQQRRYLGTYKIPEGYDAVAPKPFFEGCPPLAYQWSMHYDIKHLQTAADIINDKAFVDYMNLYPVTPYWDNMFILKKDDFVNYCNFLFNVLFEYENVMKPTEESALCSFLGERLGSYWLHQNIGDNKIYLADRIEI